MVGFIFGTTGGAHGTNFPDNRVISHPAAEILVKSAFVPLKYHSRWSYLVP